MGRAGETGPPSDATLRLARPPAPHPDAGLRPNFEPPQMRALCIVEMINQVRGPPEYGAGWYLWQRTLRSQINVNKEMMFRVLLVLMFGPDTGPLLLLPSHSHTGDAAALQTWPKYSTVCVWGGFLATPTARPKGFIVDVGDQDF